MTLFERVTTQELPPDFALLEIGVGSSPFPPKPSILYDALRLSDDPPRKPNPNFDFSGRRRYVGIDNGSAILEKHDCEDGRAPAIISQERLEEERKRVATIRPGENVEFFYGDILNPSEDPVVLEVLAEPYDMVFMSNVLSSMITEERVGDLVEVAHHLLKPKGVLVTRENFTPWIMPEDRVALTMLNIGFAAVVVAVYRDQPPAYNILAEHFGVTFKDIGGTGNRVGYAKDRYYCLAEKEG